MKDAHLSSFVLWYIYHCIVVVIIFSAIISHWILFYHQQKTQCIAYCVIVTYYEFQNCTITNENNKISKSIDYCDKGREVAYSSLVPFVLSFFFFFHWKVIIMKIDHNYILANWHAYTSLLMPFLNFPSRTNVLQKQKCSKPANN